MTDLLEIRPVSRERHSQLADGLYQVLLCVVTFECAVAIARYDPSPPTGAITWSTGGTNGSNSTTERMCRFGAREDDVDVGSLAAVLPYFILCPSTTVFIASCIIFVWGITKFNYLNRDDVWLDDVTPFIIISTLCTIDWKRILVSLQIYMPILIWIGSTISALFHKMFRLAFPGAYRRAAEARERRREEIRRKWEEAMIQRSQRNVEDGTLGEPSRDVTTGLEGVVVTDETPLLGTGSPEISGLPPPSSA